jgi:hypothetical protein
MSSRACAIASAIRVCITASACSSFSTLAAASYNDSDTKKSRSCAVASAIRVCVTASAVASLTAFNDKKLSKNIFSIKLSNLSKT